MKKIMVLLALLVVGLQAQEGVPFGYRTATSKAVATKMPALMYRMKLRKYLVVGAFASAAFFYLYRTANKYMFYLPPDHILREAVDSNTGKTILELVGNPAVHRPSSALVRIAKNVGEFVGEICAGGLFSSYGGRLLGQYGVTLNNTWFITTQTNLNGVVKAVKEDAALLPLVDDQERADYKVEIIRTKIKLLVNDVMRIIGYMHYRRQEEDKTDTLNAVRMKQVINDIETITEQFCKDIDGLLAHYSAAEKTVTERSKASKIATTLEFFTDELYANLETFDLYEQGKQIKEVYEVTS